MNPGISPIEEEIVPDETNDLDVKTQKDAHAWWDKCKAKTQIRAKNRGLTITQIYKKVILKQTTND